MAELTILVPSRGRPHNVKPMHDSFKETGAFEDQADLLLLLDADDPTLPSYEQEVRELPTYGFDGSVSMMILPRWLPMVHKLDNSALACASFSDTPLGFMGDDHRPRTDGWVKAYLKVLAEGPAIVSCPDGFRRDNLPTHWVMSSSIVRTLSRMVPAPVEHLYCDNAVRDLALGAGIYRWLPNVLVEHMHPLAGKAPVDQGYATVNSQARYLQDAAGYGQWLNTQLSTDVGKVRALKAVRALREEHGG